jgi:hypothetical protein
VHVQTNPSADNVRLPSCRGTQTDSDAGIAVLPLPSAQMLPLKQQAGALLSTPPDVDVAQGSSQPPLLMPNGTLRQARLPNRARNPEQQVVDSATEAWFPPWARAGYSQATLSPTSLAAGKMLRWRHPAAAAGEGTRTTTAVRVPSTALRHLSAQAVALPSLTKQKLTIRLYQHLHAVHRRDFLGQNNQL